MFLYVIGPADGPFKVGITKSVAQRLPLLQAYSPVPLTVHVAIEEGGAALPLEKALHRLLSERRSHGEWFAFDVAQFPALLEQARQGLSKLSEPPADPYGDERSAKEILDHTRHALGYPTWSKLAALLGTNEATLYLYRASSTSERRRRTLALSCWNLLNA